MNYFRIGNRTVTQDEMQRLSESDIAEIQAQAELANQKRLENMRKGLGLEPQKVTLDVTPAGIAARNAAIKAEEEKLAAEAEASSTATVEAEAPADAEIKKSSKKK